MNVVSSPYLSLGPLLVCSLDRHFRVRRQLKDAGGGTRFEQLTPFRIAQRSSIMATTGQIALYIGNHSRPFIRRRGYSLQRSRAYIANSKDPGELVSKCEDGHGSLSPMTMKPDLPSLTISRSHSVLVRHRSCRIYCEERAVPCRKRLALRRSRSPAKSPSDTD